MAQVAHDNNHFLSIGSAPCSNDRKFIHAAASVLHGLVGRLPSDGLLSGLSDLRRKTTFEPHGASNVCTALLALLALLSSAII